MGRIISIVFLCFSVVTAFGQPTSEYRFEKYTTAEGLPQNRVYDIVQDANGFMWFATDDGVARFDGFEFRRVGTAALSSNIVSALCAGNGSTLWIGTNKGLNAYNTETGHVDFPDTGTGAGEANISDLAFDGRYLWINYWNLAEVYDPITGKNQRLEYKGKPLLSVKSMALDKTTGKMLLTANAGLYEASVDKKGKLQVRRVLDGLKDANKIHVTEDGDMYVYGGFRIYKVKSANGKFSKKKIAYNTENWIVSITNDRQGRLWLGTPGALFRLDTTKDKLNSTVRITSIAGTPMPVKTISNLFTDRSGVIWGVEYFGGVFKVNPLERDFVEYFSLQSQDTLLNNDVRSILADSEGELWVGTRDSGLYRFGKDREFLGIYKENRLDSGTLPDKRIRCLFEDRQKRLWVGASDDLRWFDREKDHFFRFETTEGSIKSVEGTVYSIFEDSKDNIWFGSNKGIYKLDESEKLTYYRNNPKDSTSLSNDFIRYVFEDEDGVIWIATNAGGLDKLTADERFEHFRSDDNKEETLASDKVYSIGQDKYGNLWVGTHNGLSVLPKGKKRFFNLNESEGLPGNIVYGILKDDQGRMWISTNKGIAVFAGDIRAHKSKNYNRPKTFREYLKFVEFSDDAMFKSANGDLYFGGTGGYAVFYPDKIIDNPVAPKVAITELRLFNKPVEKYKSPKGGSSSLFPEALDTLWLDYGQNMFSLKFSALSFADVRANQYAYKLEGVNNGWVYTLADNRTASYTNLSPGHYTFRVKAANEDGVWSGQETRLVVIVEPPFWWTPWFLGGVLVLAILLVVLLFRYRLNVERRQKAVLERKVREATEEIVRQNKALETQNEALESQQEEILRQQKRLIEMSEEVHEADQSKLRFFTNISHEFKTPLTLILGPLEELLASENVSAPVRERLGMMRNNGRMLLRLINELMDLRKIDIGKMGLRVSEGDLKSLLEEISGQFASVAQRKRIDIGLELGDAPVSGYFDRGKLEKVVFNLLSNAVKYTPEDGSVNVSLSVEDGEALIRVADSGSGIPEEEKQKIFDRFYRVEHSVSGSGIGLSLVKELITTHKGSVGLYDNSPCGAVFELRFPIDRNAYSEEECLVNPVSPAVKRELVDIDAEETGKSPNGNTFGISEEERPVVLVVEDNPDLRLFVKATLQPDYEVLEAADGAEGLEIATEKSPDLVISDVMMPRMDGIEFCGEVKSRLMTCHIPVILLTAKTSEESRVLGYDTGADDYLAKPFSPKVLRSRVANLLANRELLRKRFGGSSLVDSSEGAPSAKDKRFIEKILKIIRRDLDSPDLGVEKIGAEIGMSRSNLYRKIKALTGMSATDFVRSTKLKAGAEFLLAGGLNVSEVAYRIGFESPVAFRKAFKKHFGVAPSAYAKQKLEEQEAE
ncbi:hybrid sensor histidine kinase/response regulator [Fulvitalea axinellae]|uniref:histidine kinase n=1 Tax=Fulvitalea axinellae TaxID=1182444 RepID=A0AAU9CGS2_9BACT|nr:hybrid sensor histidine kinase/response regulator [Fulvitalea axinellae]